MANDADVCGAVGARLSEALGNINRRQFLQALVAMGASDMVSVVIRQTLVQVNTPDEMRGRVSAIEISNMVPADYVDWLRTAIVCNFVSQGRGVAHVPPRKGTSEFLRELLCHPPVRLLLVR